MLVSSIIVWVFFAIAHFGGEFLTIFSIAQVPTIFLGAPLDESKKARLEEALGWLEALLRGHNWSAANHFTLADLSLGTTVFQIEAFDFDLGPYPRVRAWLQKYKDELEPYGFDVSFTFFVAQCGHSLN